MEVNTMITLNKNTKKAQGFLNAREWAKNKGNYSIYSLYARPSFEKISISREIESRLSAVLFHCGNRFCFTCSGIDAEGNIIVETQSNTYKII